MALEALGVATNVVGLVDFGLSVCGKLWKYYESWKDAEEDMKKMYASIELLAKTLAVLKDALHQTSLCSDSGLMRCIEESVSRCVEGVARLDKKLDKIRGASPTGGTWTKSMDQNLRRALYPFKESTLAKLKEVCTESQGHLQLALSVLQM